MQRGTSVAEDMLEVPRDGRMQKGTQAFGRHSNIHTVHYTYIPKLGIGRKCMEVTEAGRVAIRMGCGMMVPVERGHVELATD